MFQRLGWYKSPQKLRARQNVCENYPNKSDYFGHYSFVVLKKIDIFVSVRLIKLRIALKAEPARALASHSVSVEGFWLLLGYLTDFPLGIAEMAINFRREGPIAMNEIGFSPSISSNNLLSELSIQAPLHEVLFKPIKDFHEKLRLFSVFFGVTKTGFSNTVAILVESCTKLFICSSALKRRHCSKT